MAALTGFRKLDAFALPRPSPNPSAQISAFAADLTQEDDELFSKAEDELNETPERFDYCLRTLRDKIKEHPEYHFRMDSQFLLRFLRARKFDVDKAFALVRNYYQTRIQDPEVFKDLLPSALEDVFTHSLHGILPHRDREGRAILVARIGMGDISKFPYVDGFRAALLCLEKAIDDTATQINGIVAIVDFSGLSVGKLRHLVAPMNVYRHVNIAQGAFPARFKAAHVVNESTVFDICFALLKPLLSEKNKQRLYIHGNDMSSLHKYIPPSILPEEFGGELGSFNNAAFVEALRENEEIFAKDLTYGISDPALKEQENSEVLETSFL